MTVKETLLKLGITPNLNGFYYLENCITRVMDNVRNKTLAENYMVQYRICAHHYHTTPAAVERCIRHAIDVACKNDTMLYGLIFEGMSDKPANSVFVAMIAEFLLEEEKNG